MSDRDLASRHNERGRELDRQGRTAEAVREYERACELDPAWSVPHYNLGLIHGQGQAADALAELAAARGIAAEDWTTSIEVLCKACSEGRPHGRQGGPEVAVLGFRTREQQEGRELRCAARPSAATRPPVS